eukprot:CAMPEP_0185167402 /NCGR_PEP_ID=MMETSP1139-20130426/14201_1 /TAXON_ID=298111 /ORGANISM="Pavlova sp., Strain CCMP459" /LENGTH=309 /DNA_ID=CAMNT_0027732883 /DNA_START=79 /DNA_END=1005 /DNA_ORIENTATION=-
MATFAGAVGSARGSLRRWAAPPPVDPDPPRSLDHVPPRPGNDTRAFWDWVHAQQHPTNCSDVRKFVRWAGRRSGIGSQLASLVESLLGALSRGVPFTAAGVRLAYANPARCPQRSFECYFLPLGACAPTEPHQNAAPSKTNCFNNKFDASALSERAGLSRAHSALWFRSRLVHYVTRPNKRLGRNMRRVARLAGLGEPWAFRRTVAVHIRHGDKHEGVHHTVDEFARQVAFLYHWQDVETVFLGSDDPSVFEEMPRVLDRMGVFVNVTQLPAAEFLKPEKKSQSIAALLRGSSNPMPGSDAASRLGGGG